MRNKYYNNVTSFLRKGIYFMRKFRSFVGAAVVLLAFLFILPVCTKVRAASYETGIYKINTESSPLNVRSCFGTEYMKVGEIAKGTKVNVTLVSENGWGKIVYGDIHGWISLDLCKYIGEEESSSKSSKVKEENVSYGISPDNLLWVTGWKQEFSKSSGLCTSSATTSLLRRRQAAEGKEVTIIFGDIRQAMGGNPTPDKNGKYESCSSYFSSTTPFMDFDKEDSDVYYLIRDYESTHARNREYIADLLDVHPEGVVVYANYGNGGRHGILISDYVRKKSGAIQFYAYDPADGDGRCKLEDTWMISKEGGSVGRYFSNITSIWYVNGELIVSDEHFSHPEAQPLSRTVKVTAKKTYTYSKASDAKSKRVDKLAKGDTLNICYSLTDKEGAEWYITEDDLYISAADVKVTKD